MRNLVVCRTYPVQILTLAYENPNVCRRIQPTHDNIPSGLAAAAAAVSSAEATEADRVLTFYFGYPRVADLCMCMLVMSMFSVAVVVVVICWFALLLSLFFVVLFRSKMDGGRITIWCDCVMMMFDNGSVWTDELHLYTGTLSRDRRTYQEKFPRNFLLPVRKPLSLPGVWYTK